MKLADDFFLNVKKQQLEYKNKMQLLKEKEKGDMQSNEGLFYF